MEGGKKWSGALEYFTNRDDPDHTRYEGSLFVCILNCRVRCHLYKGGTFWKIAALGANITIEGIADSLFPI